MDISIVRRGNKNDLISLGGPPCIICGWVIPYTRWHLLLGIFFSPSAVTQAPTGDGSWEKKWQVDEATRFRRVFFSSPFFPFYVSLNWFQQWRQSSAAVFQIASHCIVFLGNSEDFWSIFDLFTSFHTILGYVNVTTCHHFTSRIQVSRHLDRSVFTCLTCLVLGFWKDQHQPVVEPVVDDCPNWSNIPMV